MEAQFQIQSQKKLNWCWAAVASTLAAYLFPEEEQKVSQCEIAREVLGIDCCNSANADCDQPAPLEDALDAVNTLLKKSLKNMTKPKHLAFEHIRQQIDSGRPICARMQWFDQTEGHLVMISGYSVSESKEHWVDIADPFYGDSTTPYVHFVAAYLNAGRWDETYLVGQ